MPRTDFEEINYRLRPAKCVERKMLCETFQKLSPFDSPYSYRYIGFGSISFVDFVLFHRVLGIHKMISIDRNADKKARFEFNLPYKCIKMMFGSSNEIMPTLHWDGIKSIIWMDYTDLLNNSSISDIETITSNLEPGSIMLYTLRANPLDFGRPDEDRLSKFREKYDHDLIPIDIKAVDLESWNLAKTFRKIISDRILKIIIERNGKSIVSEKLNYKQLFFFCYQDGVKMFTTGGIIYKSSQEELYNQCNFKSLNFIRNEEEDPFIIEIPVLTLNEVRFLDSQLPMLDAAGNFLDGDEEFPKGEAIPENDLIKYKRLYRYFPTFTEIEIH